MGHYLGSPVVQFLNDGRLVRLTEEFAFVDDRGEHWNVPAQATVDGASIPKLLWSLIGGPFEGRYRDASIVHDWYCDLRSRPWQNVHLMFYEAMLVSGVGGARAKLMYAAVYRGGPRWSITTVDNVTLMAERYLKDTDGAGKRPLHYPMPATEPGERRKGPYADTGSTKVTEVYKYDLGPDDLAVIEAMASADAPLAALQSLADEQAARLARKVLLRKEEPIGKDSGRLG